MTPQHRAECIARQYLAPWFSHKDVIEAIRVAQIENANVELEKRREAERLLSESGQENFRLRTAILNMRGDNLCWIGDRGMEEAKALPWHEFKESCFRYHAQISGRGVFKDGRTIAQLEARVLELELELKFSQENPLTDKGDQS